MMLLQKNGRYRYEPGGLRTDEFEQALPHGVDACVGEGKAEDILRLGVVSIRMR